MLKKLLGIGLLAMAMVCSPMTVLATETSELNDAVLFLVNDPQDLTLMDMNKLVQNNKEYQQERGFVNDSQVNEFFQQVQQHGVPNAGQGTNKVQVGYVVQNHDQETHGVIVVKGKFDQAKVIDTIAKHYIEHSKEHEQAVTKKNTFAQVQGEMNTANPYVQSDQSIGGHKAHVYPMPLRNREFIAVSSGDTVLFSSAPRGKRDLLNKTIQVVDGKIALRNPPAASKVVMVFAPTQAERKDMEKRIWARYDAQKRDSLSSKKHLKKMGERFRQRVIRNKIEFFVECLNEMENATLTIERSRTNELSKNATLVGNFESPDRANEVKKTLIKHLVKEIKRTDDVKDKFALGNVSVTTQGRHAIIRCQLKDSKEQMHAFNLISSYVTKGMMERL